MRDLSAKNFAKYRLRDEELKLNGVTGDKGCGFFAIRSEYDGTLLIVVAASGCGWDHVSVSMQFRTPVWQEMEQIKRMFFKNHEVAMQLHVGVRDHIDNHPHCLHLWRPAKGKIPVPPPSLV